MNAVTIDLCVLTVVAIAGVRGWAHGSIREFFSLAGIAVGLVAAPFLVGPLADLVHGVAGTDVNIARAIVLGVVVGSISIAGAVIGVRTATGVEISGPRGLDRVGGATFGLIRALVLAALLLYGTLAVSTDTGDGSYSSKIGNSVSGQLLASSDSPFTIVYEKLLERSTDLQALTLWVRQRSVYTEKVPGERLDLAATNERLLEVPNAEQSMLILLNEDRVERDLAELDWCEICAEVAREHSIDMYRHGYFSHLDSNGDDPFDRMRAAGITYEAAGENLSLAPSPARAHSSLMASPDHRENILRQLFDSVGIGCLKGPYGFMCTEVFRASP